MASKKAKDLLSEHDHQVLLFQWMALQGNRMPELCEAFAVPNGARTSMRTAKKLKAEGLKKGIEDIILLVPRAAYHGLLIELKKADGVASDVSPDQRAWHSVHRARGYCVDVCFGWEQARESLTWYLQLLPPRP
jgi:hypothetical protein